jgi:hypothetical protein
MGNRPIGGKLSEIVAIKEQYDPTGLFFAHHWSAVRSEVKMASRDCKPASQQPKIQRDMKGH